ncbi:hypothetical protein Bbelb_318050 [Branchiostoma belcheri]|nr:hypothetical protein Bbelb_318050 [Branchiostoma belcheri]
MHYYAYEVVVRNEKSAAPFPCATLLTTDHTAPNIRYFLQTFHHSEVYGYNLSCVQYLQGNTAVQNIKTRCAMYTVGLMVTTDNPRQLDVIVRIMVIILLSECWSGDVESAWSEETMGVPRITEDSVNAPVGESSSKFSAPISTEYIEEKNNQSNRVTWTTQCATEFDTLKDAICNDPALKVADHNKLEHTAEASFRYSSTLSPWIEVPVGIVAGDLMNSVTGRFRSPPRPGYPLGPLAHALDKNGNLLSLVVLSDVSPASTQRGRQPTPYMGSPLNIFVPGPRTPNREPDIESAPMLNFNRDIKSTKQALEGAERASGGATYYIKGPAKHHRHMYVPEKDGPNYREGWAQLPPQKRRRLPSSQENCGSSKKRASRRFNYQPWQKR